MKKIVIFAILIIGWYGNYHYKHKMQKVSVESPYTGDSQVAGSSVNSSFKCDGRTKCSQMTSCEEAKFFLKNCPDVKMDGNNDGIPCEKQWCK